MKNVFIKIPVVLFLLMSVNFVFAQGDDEPTGYYLNSQHLFYAGFVCGSNFAQVDGDNFAGYYKAGLNVGAIGYLKVAKRVSLSWEILYSQKGSNINIEQLSVDKKFRIKDYSISANYAEIPVMINVFDKLKSHIGIGVSYGKLVTSSETLQTNPTTTINLNNYPFKKDDWEILAGAHLHLIKGLFFNIRYQYSLSPIRTQVPPNFSRAEQYNNLWTVRLMYLFM